jgi:hypothetical protein
MRRFLFLLSTVLMLTAAARAQHIEVGPLIGCRFGGSVTEQSTGNSVNLKAGPTFGLVADYGPTNAEVKVELWWSRQDSSIDLNGYSGLNTLNVTVDNILIGGLSEVDYRGIRCYVGGFVGASHFSCENNGSSTYFCASVAVGAKYNLLPRLGVRADLRGYCSVIEGSGGFISTSGGTVVVLSGSTLWQGEVSLAVFATF